MSDNAKNNGTYQLITPPNLIKARVGAGLGVDTELAKRADAAVQNLQGEFLVRVAAAVSEIAAQLTLAETSLEERVECATEILRIADELRTQGAAFGYPLVSDICTSLCRYIEKLDAPENLTGEIVFAHIDVLRSIAGNAIEGDGGRVGQDLVDSLNELVARTG